jgi:hypothetical protein
MATSLDELTFIECRFPLRHSWRWGEVKTDNRKKTHRQYLVCSRCTSKKSFTISFAEKTKGKIIERHGYDYVKGFLRTGQGPLTEEGREELAYLAIARHVEEVYLSVENMDEQVEIEEPKKRAPRKAATTRKSTTQPKAAADKATTARKTTARKPAVKKTAAVARRTAKPRAAAK